ncbi:DUF1360 domain-containing protein [Streptomyces sp. NPDC032472]|uniref:DUF1360 domain-containing protein n=1 Tax=Streptomyces sp. NPDC032472 TaxID=3155018 RepID=UPI0033F812D1
MTTAQHAWSTIRERLDEEARSHSAGEDRPLAAYTGAMGVYAATVLALAGAARATGRRLPDPSFRDIALHAVATHQVARLLAKDPVTSPLRMPFTRFRGTSAPAELDEEVRGSGARKALGELLGCPFCTGLWIATALTGGSVFAPRATRLAAATLTALAGSDFLQYAREAAQHAAEDGGGGGEEAEAEAEAEGAS